MAKIKSNKVIAYLLTICMLLNVISMPVFASSSLARTKSIMQNDNQADGIVLTKSAEVKEDGTIDITIEAYTTGKVVAHEMTMPTDIVLVLDLSGSMAERQENTYTTTYENVVGNAYYTWKNKTNYGFQDEDDLYIKTDEDVYVPVHYTARDDNRYDYYYSDVTNKYYYPILNSSVTLNRSNDYEVTQFYRGKTTLASLGEIKLDVLKESVNKFIEETALKNAVISGDANKHRISIIKFAGPEYYVKSGDKTAQNAVLSENIGDNKYYDGDYNYTQVVKDLTIVTNATKNELETAVTNMTAGGATAIDYGLELAQYVFYDRSIEEITDRNEVVVVFTDGEPTHGNSYSNSVATSAINHALGLKNAGASVYTISVESHADASVLEAEDYKKGNAFMHYVSSNFPKATASIYSNAITAGEGSISSGYYMTPNENMSLDMIFNKIIHHIDNPTISLGKEATVYDHLSPYFDLATNSASDVKVQVSAKSGDGSWAAPETDSNVTAELTNNNTTIMVNGFNFDENYDSEEARDTNFYGKKLIITIKVKPDYEEINANKENLDGWIETNNGNANITNTDKKIVAEVNSPSIQMPKIIYKVDGKTYDYYYLMPGEEHNLISKPTKTGHTFSGWSSDDVTISNNKFEMIASDVVVEGEFDLNKYTVTYEYNIDPKPDEWPEIPENYNKVSGEKIYYSYGSEVIVNEDLELEGYTFKGWRMGNKNVTIISGDESDVKKFTMPDEDVELIAHFEPDTGITYHVEHWLEIVDSDNTGYAAEYAYDDTTSVSEKTFGRVYNDERHEKTGETVSTIWSNYHGFTKIDGAPSITSGQVQGDGSLVLKLYYTRDKNEVSYDYDMPIGVSKPEVPASEEYYYGINVAVKSPEEIPGYEFTGWVANDSMVNTDAKDGNFTMPNKDVKFIGSYKAKDVGYIVKYYLENIDNDDYALKETISYSGETGKLAIAEYKQYEGFKFNSEDSTSEGTILADGTLVLEMYYDRLEYTVKYDWFEPQVKAVLAKYPTLPLDAKYKYGATFTVESKLNDFAGSGDIQYSFDGWYSHEIALTPFTTQTFKMPSHDVTILGRFNGIVPEIDPTVTYEEYESGDKPSTEPGMDEVEKNKYIIVDPNDGKWTHNENGTDTEYQNAVKLIMVDDRILETPVRNDYIFTGWIKYSEITNVPDTTGYPDDTTDVKYI